LEREFQHGLAAFGALQVVDANVVHLPASDHIGLLPRPVDHGRSRDTKSPNVVLAEFTL